MLNFKDQGSKKLFSIGEFGDDKTEESKDGDVPSETQEGQVFGVKGGSKGSGSGLGKSASKCETCGKKGHVGSECTTDMSKVKCFKCGGTGHISFNCRKDSGSKSSGTPSMVSSQSKGKSVGGKGKGKGGKKGKLYAIWDQDSETWWYSEISGDETEETEEQKDQESLLVLSCVLRTFGETSTNLENEPNTRLDLCSVLSPNDESEAADQVMTEPTHLKGEHCEVRHGSNAPDSLVFGNPPKGNAFGEQVLNPLLQSLGQ